jgi:hypothetical protein
MRSNIWAQLVTLKSTGGIWLKISDIELLPLTSGEASIWFYLNNRPAGMWGEIEHETLVLNRNSRKDIWEEINDITLIIRPHHNIWLELETHPAKDLRSSGIWREVGEETLITAPRQSAVWSQITQTSKYLQQKPLRRLGWALKKLQTLYGEDYFTLKNLRTGEYMRLTTQQAFLWNLMDGEHTVQDMAIAYFVEYKSMAIQGLVNFLVQVETKGFLVEQRVNAYTHTSKALGQKRLSGLRNNLWRFLTQASISSNNIDPFFSLFYRLTGWLIFNRVIQSLFLILTIAGLLVFGFHSMTGNFSLLRSASGSVTLGIISLYILQFLALILHELSHALTCKHYGRVVSRGGFMLYFGMPVLFINTTDIWMEPRRPRMLVSWAGPYSGFLLAALSSLLILFIPSRAINNILFQFASVCFLVSITNLNPLLKLDGYYLLMDWLEMPMLRNRAIYFTTRKMWQKISLREAFTKDEKIFSVFGTLSLGWTVFALISMVWLFGNVLQKYLQIFLGPLLGSVSAIVLISAVAAFLLQPFLKSFISRKSRAQSQPELSPNT